MIQVQLCPSPGMCPLVSTILFCLRTRGDVICENLVSLLAVSFSEFFSCGSLYPYSLVLLLSPQANILLETVALGFRVPWRRDKVCKSNDSPLPHHPIPPNKKALRFVNETFFTLASRPMSVLLRVLIYL